MNGVEWGKRLGVLVLVAALVVAGASTGAMVGGGGGTPDAEPLALPEYRAENATVEPLPAEGTIQPDGNQVNRGGTVVIDAGHNNRFRRSDVQPLVEALTRVGYDVEFYTQGDLAAALEDAQAFVVIDPGSEYPPGDVDDVRRFTGQGGHLLIAGEPSRVTVGGGLFGGLILQESRVTTLATAYGMSLDTAYLYNQNTEYADTNYKFITAEPAPNADIAGVNRTTMYTAAAVRAQGGQVLLRSSPKTIRSSTDDERGQYPVAVRRKNAVLVGDTTFMQPDKHNVADNEAFMAYLVEYLASSDRSSGQELTASNGGSGGAGAPSRPADGGE
ncbi:MAG: hypothetical protein ABEH78_07465 [Haloferacaceae archaeon]